MGEWVRDFFGDLIIEQPKSKIKVDDAYVGEQYPFFTSGEKILSYTDAISDGDNLYFATGGKANIKYYDGPCSYSTDTWAVKSKKVNNKFLYYWGLNHLEKVDYLYFSGSGLKHLQKRDFKRDIVYYPAHIIEQSKIAEVLSTIDEAIEKTEAIIEKYRVIKEGLLKDLLTNGIDEQGKIRSPQTHKYKPSPIGNIPVEWSCKTLGDLAQIVTKLAGFEFSNYFNSYSDGGEIIVIRGINITSNEINLTDVRCIPDKVSKLLPRSKLNKGDIVFAYVGTVGPVWMVDEDNKYHLGPNIAKILIKKSVCSEYILEYFKSTRMQKEIDKYLSVGAQSSLSMSKIRKFLIAVPDDINEQVKIANILQSIQHNITMEVNTLNKLNAQKKGLMQDLLTRKVTVDALL